MKVVLGKLTKSKGVYRVRVLRDEENKLIGAVSLEIKFPFNVTAVSCGKNLPASGFVSNILPGNVVKIGWSDLNVKGVKGAELANIYFTLESVQANFSSQPGMCEIADPLANVIDTTFEPAVFTTVTIKQV